MRKLIASLLIGCMVFATTVTLTGCSGGEKEKEKEKIKDKVKDKEKTT